MKKVLSVLLSLIMVLSALPLSSVTAFAADSSELPEIDSVTIAPVYCTPGKSGDFVSDSVYDEATGKNVLTDKYYKYRTDPRDITLTFVDGTSKTYAYYEFKHIGYSVSVTSDQSYYNQYSENSTHTAYLNIDGNSYPYDIIIGENMIEKLEVEDVTLYENVGGHYGTDPRFDSETGEITYSPEYFYYEVEDLTITVTLKDGRRFKGSPWYLDFILSEFPLAKLGAVDAQNYENQWKVGNTYSFKLYYGANITEFKCKIVENPVAKIEIDDFEIPELTNGYYGLDDQSQEVFCYSPRPSAIKLIYKDGTSEVLTASEIFDKFEDGERGFSIPEDTYKWTAGNTYPMSFNIGDVVADFNVTITPRSEESRKYVYNDSDDGITILKYTGDEEILSVPASIDGKNVTAIDFDAFLDNTALKQLTLPSGLQSIGTYAFFGCENLEYVVIPDTVTKIHSRAFGNCPKLKSVYIPQSVKTLGSQSFGIYDIQGTKRKWVEGFTVYGRNDSEAQDYAERNGFNFVSVGEYVLNFPDVTRSDWFYNAVLFNTTRGYLQGYENGYFGVADNMQRQDFVVFLARIDRANLHYYEEMNSTFSDVPTDAYYFTAVMWAKDMGIISGYEDGSFGVGDPITREQVCKILYNYCKGSVKGDTETILANYPDGDTVSDWARDYVAWAAENHIIGGNGTLNPAGNANRAEMAQIIMNMSNNNIL